MKAIPIKLLLMKKSFRKKTIAFFVSLVLLATTSYAQKTHPSEVTNNELMGWFREAKFGMFIHFGAETPERLRDSEMTRTEKHEAAVREFNPDTWKFTREFEQASVWVDTEKRGENYLEMIL